MEIRNADDEEKSIHRRASRMSVGMGTVGQLSCLDGWAAGYYTINPEQNKIVDAWDVVVIMALSTTAFLLPFEVALLDTEHPPRVVYVIGKVLDLVFIVDIFVSFNIAYTITGSSGATGGDRYDKRPCKIIANYMAVPFSNNLTSGWFWPDVLTVVPWEEFPGIEKLSELRLVRVLRLVRMLRLVRVIKLFKRWQTHSGFSFSLVNLLTCGTCTLLLVHWLACLWAHLGLYPFMESGSREVYSWLSNHLTQGQDVENMDVLQIYSNALYLCTVVLTTVGFGDIVPTNTVEVVTMIVTILLTAITWAWVVANVVNVITNMDVYGTHFNQTMDDMNSLMDTHYLDNDLKLRIRRHIHESYTVQREVHHHDAIAWLSEGLQGELAIQSGMDKVISNVWYFRNLPQSVVVELADEFKAQLFSPNEVIMDRNSASVILRGSCIKRGKMYRRDNTIGEDFILSSEHLRDTSCPRTITFLEVMTLQRNALMDACSKFPDFDYRLRRAQIRLALWRAFIRAADEIKRAKTRRKNSKGGVDRGSAWDQRFFDIDDDENRTNQARPDLSSSFSTDNIRRQMSRQSIIAAGVGVEKAVGWSQSFDSAPGQSKEKAPQELMEQVLDEIKSLTTRMEEAREYSLQRWQEFDQRFTKLDVSLVHVDRRIDKFADEVQKHDQMIMDTQQAVEQMQSLQNEQLNEREAQQPTQSMSAALSSAFFKR